MNLHILLQPCTQEWILMKTCTHAGIRGKEGNRGEKRGLKGTKWETLANKAIEIFSLACEKFAGGCRHHNR